MFFTSLNCVFQSEVYLPQALRQLLRRNLGAHALEIAQTCTKLPYFNHSLELLLHEVLEEEGTSSAPIPDPLLPSVVAFVQEFPVFLQTIAHCARKSDIALWPRLFIEAGEPADLFRECLDSQQLEVAASFLIVLNSTLPAGSVRKLANALLEKARERNDDLAAETSRFLRALEQEEQEGQRHTPEFPVASSKSPGALRGNPEPLDLGNPMLPQSSLTFKYGPPVRNKSLSESAHGMNQLKRASSVPYAGKEEPHTRSVSVVVAPALNGLPQSSTVTGAVDRLSLEDHSLNGVSRTSSGPSLPSKNGWNRRRFPGHAQPEEV